MSFWTVWLYKITKAHLDLPRPCCITGLLWSICAGQWWSREAYPDRTGITWCRVMTAQSIQAVPGAWLFVDVGTDAVSHDLLTWITSPLGAMNGYIWYLNAWYTDPDLGRNSLGHHLGVCPNSVRGVCRPNQAVHDSESQYELLW